MIGKVNKTVAHTIALVSICCYVLFSVGCCKKIPPPESISVLENRLKAAKMITFASERNAALEKVAGDAVKERNVKVCMEAIMEINQTGIRNSTAASTASLFAEAGKIKEAIKIVELINDTSLQNKMLTEIATQQ